MLPDLNQIEIKGKASIEAERTTATCSECSTTNQTIEKYGTEYVVFYGVDVKLDTMPLILVNLVDEKGYATADYKIYYTIEPSEYQALTAYVFIYKDGNPEPIAQIPTEIKGRGFATISRGFQFDINSKYEAEVVLNYGTGVEIKSGKVLLPVVQLNVLTDEGADSTKVDEIKFGDGNTPKKRYKIELQSKTFAGTCETLNDTGAVIKLVLSNGEPVKPPDESNYYPVQYDLKFSNSSNGCSVKIDDKEKFIITNRVKKKINQKN